MFRPLILSAIISIIIAIQSLKQGPVNKYYYGACNESFTTIYKTDQHKFYYNGNHGVLFSHLLDNWRTINGILLKILEDSFSKTKQRLNNKSSHLKFGNKQKETKYIKLMTINKGNSRILRS